jgi:hemoglobin/transferrin/lactoferrin receptor protein
MIALLLAVALQQQQPSDTTKKPAALSAITVTATRSERSTFDTPQAVSVLDSAAMRERVAHSPVDLFRDAVGLDVSGSGPQQRRPEIRLQRGQRILLLSDGLRLNNSRRQQDFGELPALTGVSLPDRVEVVRGPSSVLYGTDAIGGVINIISGRIPRSLPGDVHGVVTYRFGSAGEGSTPSINLSSRVGRFGFMANVGNRNVADYTAPAGTFGSITLTEPTQVFDSGIRDRSASASLEYDLSATSSFQSRVEMYDADQAGFGWIDPAKLGAGQPRVQIVYPSQQYQRYSLGYRARVLSTWFAHRADVTAYVQNNARSLNNLVFVPISATANVDSRSWNFTDMQTIGGRVELARSIFDRHVLTYGVDAFSDRSRNTDSSRSVTTGFGPAPIVRTSNVPSVPNATYRSAGAFTQLELNPFDRLTAVLGGRVQDVFAETKETASITRALVSGTHRTGVWTANALYRVTGDLNVITAVGRGFRAPNLVERFFEGAATESNGTQVANPALGPETSLNVDVGARYRVGPGYAEAFVFRNDIRDAIRGVATGNTVSGRPEFQNRNIGKLRVDGLEVTTGLRFARGLEASLNGTWFEGTNVSNPGAPIGDSYSSKVVGDLGYRSPSGLFSLGYTVRRQGETSEVIVGTNPIGPVIPAFTVHSARAGLRLPGRLGIRNQLSFAVENIGNTLYAEFPNAGFFRPEPGRNMNVSLVSSF